MTRRSLFGILAAAVAIDPERLLWAPGKKLISIPKEPALYEHVFTEQEIIAAMNEMLPDIVSDMADAGVSFVTYPLRALRPYPEYLLRSS
jgi:hypothetical protein